MADLTAVFGAALQCFGESLGCAQKRINHLSLPQLTLRREGVAVCEDERELKSDANTDFLAQFVSPRSWGIFEHRSTREKLRPLTDVDFVLHAARRTRIANAGRCADCFFPFLDSVINPAVTPFHPVTGIPPRTIWVIPDAPPSRKSDPQTRLQVVDCSIPQLNQSYFFFLAPTPFAARNDIPARIAF